MNYYRQFQKKKTIPLCTSVILSPLSGIPKEESIRPKPNNKYIYIIEKNNIKKNKYDYSYH